MPLIAPSVLAADFANLQSEVEMLNRSEADWIHVDIMDGRFVPNISFGLPVCEAIHRHATKPLDVHLMIVQPEQYLADFKAAGAANITVHYEACPHLHRTLQQIKQLDCQAGVALNPHTPVEVLIDIIRDVDIVLLMSVNPGFGGQTFIEQTYDKICRLRALLQEMDTTAHIEIDGGVSDQNALKLLTTGADVLVAGSFVFKADQPIHTITHLKQIKVES